MTFINSEKILYELIGSCASGCSNTILQIAEQCQILNKYSTSPNQAKFFKKAGPLLSPIEILSLQQKIDPSDFLDVVENLPMNKRYPAFISELLVEILNKSNEATIAKLSEKLSKAIISLLTYRQTLFSCQIHSICFSSALNVFPEKIHYDFGFLCETCTKEIPITVCLICAHRCHQGHSIQPLGMEVISCNCSFSGNCCSKNPLPLPSHIKLKNIKTLPLDMVFHYEPSILTEQNGEVSYISRECDTGTLVGDRPMCEIEQINEECEDPTNLTSGYFEVEILIGGTYDQIAIGLTDDASYPLEEFAGYKEMSIAFHGDDGKCYINGQGINYGCKFGSYDIVGCGTTQDGDVFFTCNGMLFPLVNLQLTGKIYPLISMRGKFSNVRINMGPNFNFEFEKLLELPNPTTSIIADKYSIQYFLKSSVIQEKLSLLINSTNLLPATREILKTIFDNEESLDKVESEMCSHKHHNSLFSNPEETKTELAARSAKKQHTRYNTGDNFAIIEKGKSEEYKNKLLIAVDGSEDFSNSNKDYKLVESKSPQSIPNNQITQQPPIISNVERIGDNPPAKQQQKKENKKQETGGSKKCSCGSGNDGCVII